VPTNRHSDGPAHETDLQRTVRLLAEARTSSPEVARQLEEECVRLNMPLARSLAGRYVGRSVSTDDLHQVAYLGLLKAVRRFDPDRGDPFLSFATPTIRGELRRHFRDSGWVIRPPRRVQELQARVWAAEEELVHSLHRSPTAAEVAAAVDADEEAVLEALSVGGCFAPASLDAPRGPTSDTDALVDRLGAAEDGYERADALLSVADALKTLSERDRRIIGLRFVSGLTQQEIGAAIGVTQMQVSRLLLRIMRDLRSAVGEGVAA